MNKKQRIKNRKTYAKLMQKLAWDNPPKYLSQCQNCGEYGSHFIPPCFGDDGYYFCTPINITKENQ